jgi:DNA polymerase III epsilon subunit family exonuclease
VIGKMLNEQEAANIKDYVVFDLETTGLSPDYNEIINIGGLLVQNGVVTQEFNTLVKPRKAIPQEIIQLTGITNEAVQNAPSINVALKSFLEAIGDDTVVLGHNLGFDCRFISAKKKQVYRSSRAEFTNPYIDTLPLAKSLFRLKSYKLTTLSEHFGITHNDAHTALADCYAAYELFCIIQNELSLRKSLLA